MSDPIERQAALDAIHCDITVTGRQNAELVAATIGAFADRIKALPSAQPEQRWIPCSERLQEGGRVVLVTEKGGLIRHCEYANYCDFQEFQTVEEGLTVHDVIAWMPLPEPYKGKNHEKIH